MHADDRVGEVVRRRRTRHEPVHPVLDQLRGGVVGIGDHHTGSALRRGLHDDQPVDNEFNEYLKGRFDFKGNETYPVGCPFFDSVSQGEASKRDLENQMRQANKQVVEVRWGFKPNEAEIALSSAPRTEREANGPPRPRPTHTWCLSDTYQGTVYATGPFDTDQNWAQWYQGFNRFLKEKYSFPGRVECKVTTLSDARRLMSARTEGARAAGTLPPGVKTASDLSRMIANDYLDAAVAAFFLLAVVVILVDSVREWLAIVRGSKQALSTEVPFQSRVALAGD